MWFLIFILAFVSGELIDLTSLSTESTNVVSTTVLDDPIPSFVVPPGGCVYSLLTYKDTKPLLPSTTFVACPSTTGHPCKPLCNTKEFGKMLYNNPFKFACNNKKEHNITLHRTPGATCAPACFLPSGICPLDPSTGVRGTCMLTDVSTGMHLCGVPCETNDDCRSLGYEERFCYNHVCLWNH